MMSEEQAAAYAGADLSDLHQPVMNHFRECFPGFAGGLLLDLGCGCAGITIRFALAYPELQAIGVDGSSAMLQFGRQAVQAAQLQKRISLKQRCIPDPSLEGRQFDVVTANSLLHHLEDPNSLWSTASLAAKPGGAVMVMDLRRPPDTRAAHQLVEEYASEAHPALRRDFFNSLCAAYTPEEIQRQVEEAGLSEFKVAEVSALHVLVWGRTPESRIDRR